MPNMKCQIRSWFSTQRKKPNLSSWPHRWWVLTICSGNWNSIGWNRHSWNGNLMHQFVKLLKLHLIVCWSWIIATRKRGLELEYFWLKNVLEQYTMQGAFNSVVDAAHMRRVPNHRNRNAQHSNDKYNSRSRSKSKGQNRGDTSFVMDNITSILSPNNLRKIERKNLYEK